MNKIAIVIDSGMDLPPEYKREGVFVLPLKIIRDGETFLDGVSISPEQVAAELATHDYKTSLVAAGEVIEFLEGIKQEGYNQIIIITISSGLSGTNNAFRVGASTVTGIEFAVIDTLSIGIGAGLHAVAAIDLKEAGNDFHTIVEKLQAKVPQSKVYFCVGTLDYLVKGGRIGKISGFAGQMLNLKPVITCDFEGIYSTVAKVRGQTQGANRIIELIVEGFKDYPKDFIDRRICY